MNGPEHPIEDARQGRGHDVGREAVRMVSKIRTCPHCGAGAGPHDTQCWRCGGLLVPSSVGGKETAPGIREVGRNGTNEPLLKPVMKDVGGAFGRERELWEKERALKAEMEALESQNRKVEKLFRKLDEEKKSLEALKTSLSAQEDDLYTRAAILQSAMQAAQVQPKKGAPFEEITADRLDGVDPEPVLAMERARIRQELEEEMAGQLERINQLETNLSAREDELYTKAAILQHTIKSDDGKGADGSHKNASILHLAAGGDLEPVLVLEKSRIRKEIERDMGVQLERLAQKEAELKAAYDLMGAGAIVVRGLPDSMEAAIAYAQCLKMKEGGIDIRFYRLTKVNGALTLSEINAASLDQAKDESLPTEQ